MWMRFVVFSFWLVLCVQGLDRASLRRSSDSSGRCQYSFIVDSPLESSCPGSSSIVETENLNARLTLLEVVVSRILDARPVTKADIKTSETENWKTLHQDKKQLDRQIQELQRQVQELTDERDKLREKPCPLVQTEPTNSFGIITGKDPGSNGAYQEMKAEVLEVPVFSKVPVPFKGQENEQNNAGCGELISVGEPITHQKANSITGRYGVWFQDPESPGAPYGPSTVWRIDAVGKDVRELFAYENLEQLSRGYPLKVLLLPEPMESTGATVYHGSLYYQRQRSPMLLRYNLTAESIVAQAPLPQAGFHGQYPYSWGGYTDIDLVVDEKGLWAIYSTEKARGAIVVSQLDPESLKVTRSWETNIQKNKVANAFMVCGRLYTVASYSTNSTNINFTFDTASGQSKAVDVPFRNHYGYNSMVDYNAARKKLYAWDNFHMVTYDVKLGKTSGSQ